MLANIIRNRKKTGIGGGGGGIVIDNGDPFYSAVSLLLPMDGTNGSTTFTDSSLNALTVTAVGNAQISTTQSKYGGASGYFDGAGDYLSISPSTAIDLSSSDFTIEFWIRPAPKTNAVDAAFGYSNYACMFYHNGINWTLEMSSTGFSNQLVISFAVTLNTWQHIAIVRSGTSVVVYKDGVSSASGTFTGTVATSGRTLRIGDNGNSQNINGYIDDFRISKFARYTSTFTPPTAALPTIASSTPADPYYGQTSLLLHMDGTNASTNFVDSGPSARTITAVGNAQISTTQSKYGGASGYFDGTGDYLSLPNNSIFAIGTTDFTVEFWIYITARKAYGYVLSTQGGTNGLYISFDAAGNYLRLTNDTTVYAISSTLNLNQWYHVAVVRSNGSSKIYVDGVGGTAVACSLSFVQSGPLIGGTSTANYFQGYLDDFRISRFARYTSAFAPPAQAFPNIYNPYASLPVSGAALWLAGDDSSTLYTDAGTSAVTKSGDLVYQWTDKSGNSRNATQTTSGNRPTWVAPANARNNLGAVAFNGTSQFLNLASDPIGTNDYTIEFWMKQEATTASYWVILDSRVSGNAIGYPVILYNNSSTALSFYNNGWLLSATVSVSTWTHVAITRSSGTIRMFINGSIASSGTDTSSYNTFRQLGKAFDPYYFKGQIQNLIIYNGQALYTANFTPWMS